MRFPGVPRTSIDVRHPSLDTFSTGPVSPVLLQAFSESALFGIREEKIVKLIKYFILIIFLCSFTCINAYSAVQTKDDFKAKLAFDLRSGRTYKYSITSSRSVTDDVPQPMFWQSDKQITRVMQVTEDGSYLLQTKMEKENKQRNVAIEYFRRNYPTYQVELKPDGHMTTPPRQPFPQVRNVPIFPDYEVGAGDKWVVEDVPFYPGGLVDEVTADWEYELVEFVKHNDFNTAHIKAKAKVDISLRPVTMALLGFYGDPDREEKGAFIRELVPDSPAVAAGLEPGDKILTIAGVKILDWYDIPELMPYLPPGEEVTIEYERSGEPGMVTFKTGTTQIAEVEGGGGFEFDIYFGVNRGHIISMDGKTDDLVLTLHSDKGEEIKNITSHIHMEFLPEG